MSKKAVCASKSEMKDLRDRIDSLQDLGRRAKESYEELERLAKKLKTEYEDVLIDMYRFMDHDDPLWKDVESVRKLYHILVHRESQMSKEEMLDKMATRSCIHCKLKEEGCERNAHCPIVLIKTILECAEEIGYEWGSE